jgi:hypothetical protein
MASRMKETYDLYSYSIRDDLYRKLYEVFEELGNDATIADNVKDKIVMEIMESFHYPDCNCPDCLGEVGRPSGSLLFRRRSQPPRPGEPSTNYPHRIEDDDDGGLIATYECRKCGYIYQVGYAKGFRDLQFG